MTSITLKTVMDKKPSELTESEAILFAPYLFDYLKQDRVKDAYSDNKLTVTLSNGSVIQHVDDLVLMQVEGSDMGYQDELVYVMRNQYGKKHLVGMDWNRDMNVRVSLVRLLKDSDLKQIALSVSFTNAYRKA